MQNRTTLLAVALFLSVASTIFAQTGRIAGAVQDATGGSVPHAQVTLKNVDTDAARSAMTDATGVYSVPELAAGKYDITITASGFQNEEFRGVTLTVGQNLTLNGTLAVGATSQSIDVQGDAVPTVDTEDAQISNMVDARRMENLPLITRDPYSLVALSNGVQKTTSSLGGFSINGQRERNNNFQLDGLDNNDASVPGIAGGITSINPDSAQEFRVITNNFLPEYGRNTGAIVDVITRSGTNSFHGTVYEFHRDRDLAARDYFNPTPDPQDPFVYNDFGASLGGPIQKDKTFFFVNAEWQRVRQSLANESTVPTAAFKSGIFNLNGETIDLSSPSSPNNVLGLSLDPKVQKILAAFPNPNGPLIDGARGIYNFSTSLPSNSASTTFRLDRSFGEKLDFYARYVYNGSDNPNSTAEILPGVGGVSSSGQTHNLSAGLTYLISPTLTNEFRAGINRADLPFYCNGTRTLNQLSTPDPFGAGTDYDFGTALGQSTIAGIGCGALGDSDGQARRAGTWDVRNNATWVHGNHTVKGGFEFRYVFDLDYDAFSSRPSISFDVFSNYGISTVGNCSSACQNSAVVQTLGAILLGLPAEQSQNQFFNSAGQRTATDYRQFVQHEYSTFLEDVWKIRPNLTLSYGLRYQFNGVPFERNANLSNLLDELPWTSGDKTFQLVGPGAGRQLINNDPFNFEPRIGLAWDPAGNGKTSFRLGYGIFHDRLFGNLFGNIRSDPPFLGAVQNYPQTAFSLGSGPLVTLSALPAPATVPTPSATVPEGSYLSGVVLLDPNLKNPYSQAWNAGVQRQLRTGMTLSIDYVANNAHRLFRSVDGNPPLPALIAAGHENGTLPYTLSGPILRLAPEYGYPQVTGNTVFNEPVLSKSVANSNFNSLQVGLNQQFHSGVQFQVNYTWGHAIDDANDPIVAAAGNRNIARDVFNLEEDRGDSDYDVRQRVVANFVIESPFGKGKHFLTSGIGGAIFGGWQISGLSSAQSGLPYTVYGTSDSQWVGLSNYPDVVGSMAVPAGAPRNQFGPAVTSFANPPFGRKGTFGRNSLVGPRYVDTDAGLHRTFDLTEHFNLQFRAEVFNLFNHVLFSQPDNVLGDTGTFGQSLSTISQADGTTSARQIQLALKLNF